MNKTLKAKKSSKKIVFRGLSQKKLVVKMKKQRLAETEKIMPEASQSPTPRD
jgi:hypothetical protein